MSLLDNPSENYDLPPEGKASSDQTRALRAMLLAILLVAVAIGLYVYFGQKPPVAAATLEQIFVHPVHEMTKQRDAAGVEGPEYLFDQQLLLAKLRITNQSKNPLVISGLAAEAGFSDGKHSSEAAGAGDYDRLFVAYPAIAGLKGTPLTIDQTIEPGQTAEGWVASQFHVSKEDWNKRKDTKLIVSLRYQKSLEIAAPDTIPEQ